MKSAPFHIKSKGFLLLEALLLLLMLGMMSGVLLTAIIGAKKNVITDEAQQKAWRFAQESMEVMKNIREKDYALLANGTYGLALQNNAWLLSPLPTTENGFTRTVEITDNANGAKNIKVTVTWSASGTAKTIEVVSQLGKQKITQSEYIVFHIDTNTVVESSGGHKALINMGIENTGPTAVTIDKITFEWTNNGEGGQRELIKVEAESVPVWEANGIGTPDGNQFSPTTLDISDIIINSNETKTITKVRFDQNMMNHAVTIKLILSDGSTAETTFITPPN